MRKLMLVVAALAITACSEMPNTTGPQVQTQPQFTLGNGYPMPSFDYQMQIIGVPKGKTATMDGNNGHRIFVMLESDNVVTTPGGKNNDLKNSDVNKIFLCNSTDGANDFVDPRCDTYYQTHYNEFNVIDGNATDANGGVFALPDPCPGDDSSLTACTPTYAIWARALAGKGSATITTCADETGTGFDGYDDIWCGSNGITLDKKHNFRATDVSGALLHMTITVDATNDGLLNCIQGTTGIDYLTGWTGDVYLFDRCFENYFWNYDNNGLKNLQLRFYKL